jgi:gliding motility-associated-like protein
VSPSSTATYTAIVTNSGCSKDTTVTVTVSPAITVNISSPRKVCAGDTVILRATGGGTYRWSPGGTTGDSVVVKPNANATYTVTVFNGCTGTTTTSVKVYNPILTACCDTIIQAGNSAHLSASGAGITQYSWAPGNSVNCATCPDVIVSPTVTTSYTVTGTDSGCSREEIILVTVEQPCTGLIIPNVLTPTNGGTLGLDNSFYINTISLNSWSVLIFDRWGKEVFKTSSLTQYWDGKTESGGPAPEGIYYYIINATCDGNTTKKEGFVQLIR